MRQLKAYRESLTRGDLTTVWSNVQDREWLEDLKLTTAERVATSTYLDEIWRHLSGPPPDVAAALRVVNDALEYWEHQDRYP